MVLCEQLPFSVGCTIKYLFRAGLKGPAVEDLQKAQFYLQQEMVRISKLAERADDDSRRTLAAADLCYEESEDVARVVCSAYDALSVWKDPLPAVLTRLYGAILPDGLSTPLLERLSLAEKSLDGAIVSAKVAHRRNPKRVARPVTPKWKRGSK